MTAKQDRILTAIITIDRDASFAPKLRASLSDPILVVTRSSDTQCIAFWKKHLAIVLTVPNYDISPDRRHNFPPMAAKRTLALTTAKKLKYDYVLFVDADVVPPEQVDIKNYCHMWIKTLDCDVVGVPYSIRWATDGKKLCGLFDGTSRKFQLFCCDDLKHPKQCSHLGFGCTMLKHTAFDVKIEHLQILDGEINKELVSLDAIAETKSTPDQYSSTTTPTHTQKETRTKIVYEGEDIGFFTHCFFDQKRVFVLPDIGLSHLG